MGKRKEGLGPLGVKSGGSAALSGEGSAECRLKPGRKSLPRGHH